MAQKGGSWNKTKGQDNPPQLVQNENTLLKDEVTKLRDQINAMKAEQSAHCDEVGFLKEKSEELEKQLQGMKIQKGFPDPEPYSNGRKELFVFEKLLENKFQSDPRRFATAASRLNYTFQLLRGDALICVWPHYSISGWKKLGDFHNMIKLLRDNIDRYSKGLELAPKGLLSLLELKQPPNMPLVLYSREFLTKALMGDIHDDVNEMTLKEIFIGGLSAEFKGYYSTLDLKSFENLEDLFVKLKDMENKGLFVSALSDP